MPHNLGLVHFITLMYGRLKDFYESIEEEE